MEYSESSLYSELLTSYIKDSGLSLGEISKKMLDEKGVRIDRSYISMLRNNKTKNPASDEINRALAEITGGDPDKLVYAAYIEKAPKELKEILLLFQEGLGKTAYLTLLAYIKYLKENVPEEEIALTRFIRAKDNYDKLDSSDELKLFFLLVEDSKNRGIDLRQMIDSTKQVAAQMEFKKGVEGFLECTMPYLTLEKDKFHSFFEEDVIAFADTHQIPSELISKPSSLKCFTTEDFSDHKDISLLDLLLFLLGSAWKYRVLAHEKPGFNKNIKIELDKWLSDGEITYKEIPLTSSDKSLISIYIDALLKDRIDKLDNNKEN